MKGPVTDSRTVSRPISRPAKPAFVGYAILFAVLLAAPAAAIDIPASPAADASAVPPRGTDETTTAGVEPANRGSRASTGPYLAIGGGLALGDLGTGAVGGGRIAFAHDVDTVSGSINLRAGWRLLPFLAGELLWDYQTGWDFEAATEDATLTVWNLTTNAKVWLTDTDWQPFLVGGIGLGRREADSEFDFFDPSNGIRLRFHDTDQGFVARIGGGIDVRLDEAWTFGLEVVYVRGAGGLDQLDYATTSVVLGYRFG